jgi:hypothetical protein
MENHGCKKEFEDIYWEQAQSEVPKKFDELKDVLELSINVFFGLASSGDTILIRERAPS